MQLFLKRPWKVLFETVVPLATLGSSEMPNSMPLYIFCSCAFMVLPVTTAFPPTLRESAVRAVGQSKIAFSRYGKCTPCISGAYIIQYNVIYHNVWRCNINFTANGFSVSL